MSTSIENRVWNDILLAVEKRLNRQSFETWIRPIHFEGFDEDLDLAANEMGLRERQSTPAMRHSRKA